MSVQLVNKPMKVTQAFTVPRRGFRCEECDVGTVIETSRNCRPVHMCDNPDCGKEYPNLVV